MKAGRNQLIGSLAAAALIAGIAAPVTQAGHDDFGVLCGLAFTQHRINAAKIKICAADTSASQHTRRAPAPTPNVTIVQPSTFDWGDAGIGAAGAVGLVALTGGVVLLSRDASRSGESTSELTEAGNA